MCDNGDFALNQSLLLGGEIDTLKIELAAQRQRIEQLERGMETVSMHIAYMNRRAVG